MYYDQGMYRIRIINQTIGENTKGNPEVRLTIKPIGMYMRDAENKDKVCEMDGKYDRTIYLVLTDKTLGTADQPGWVLQTLGYLGFNGTSFAQLDPDSDNHVSLVGKEIDAVCLHDTYEGKTREHWNIQRSTTLQPPKPLPKKALRQLDAKFAKLLKAMPANTVTSGVPETTLAQQPAAKQQHLDPVTARVEEDIPF